ncbi:MAG TPA: hypothetical protein P5140_08035 [Methanofastidiosum sp.]|nr:hypothetical protein [Methanofastidiosum sp.]
MKKMKRIAVEDIFGFFYGLKDLITEKSEELQELLESQHLLNEAREFTGAYYGLLSDVDHFLDVVNRVEGKLGPVKEISEEIPGEEITIPITREALVSGEDEHEELLDKKLGSNEKIKPGDRITTLPPLDRKDSVGSQYDPEFLAEECVRLVSHGERIGGVYTSVKEAFEELVKKDVNLNKSQIEKTRAILKSWGFTV